MKRYDTHVCLVSGQATPNITPALDPDFRPRRVVLVVSKEMQNQADSIEKVLKQQAGVKTERILIGDAYDIRGIEDQLLDWLSGHDGEDIALNVTGGTKPMAIAAQEAFRTAGLPVFYIHPEKDRVISLFPAGESYDLRDRIKLRSYLSAHGYEIDDFQRPDLPRKGRELTGYLLGLVSAKARLIGQLNFYAYGAEKSLISEELERHHLEDAEFQLLIERLEADEMLELKNKRLYFRDESSRFFCNGGWLEFHALGVVNDLRAELPIQDVAMSMQVVSAKGSKNEIDVAVLADNRLYLIECKTKRFAGKGMQQGAAETLYKIDSLTALGGLNTKGMLVSYQTLSDWDKQRAKDLRIETVVGADILRLRERLKTWMSPKG